MNELNKLKKMLTDELEEYGRKGELSAGSLEIVDKLSHALKSLTTVIAMEGDGYSEEHDYRGASYARNRNARGRYSRYSEAMDDMVDQLHSLMDSAPDPETRKEIQRLITKLEK